MKQKSLLFALLFASASCFAQPKAGNMQKLVQGDAGFMCPTWSPDSKKVAITGDNFKGIWIAEINGSGLAQITAEAGAGYKMAWNATGEKILAAPIFIAISGFSMNSRLSTSRPRKRKRWFLSREALA